MRKNIFITGASGNLGKATVEKFLSEGHHVICTVSSKGLGFSAQGDLTTVEVDLTNEQQISSVIQTVIEKNGAIDVAVLLVGAFATGNIENTDGAALKKMFSLNFDTAYFCARPIFNQMKRRGSGGRLVLIGSRPSLEPDDGKNSLAYALSKSLLFKLAEFLNAEGAKDNIVTSVVVPSVIDTPANRASSPTADFSAWVAPEVIANSIYFATMEDSLRDPVFKIYGRS